MSESNCLVKFHVGISLCSTDGVHVDPCVVCALRMYFWTSNCWSHFHLKFSEGATFFSRAVSFASLAALGLPETNNKIYTSTANERTVLMYQHGGRGVRAGSVWRQCMYADRQNDYSIKLHSSTINYI